MLLDAGATTADVAAGDADAAVLLVVIGSGTAALVVAAALDGGGEIVNMGAAPIVAVGVGTPVLDAGASLVLEEGIGAMAEALAPASEPSPEIVMSAHW